MEIVQFSAIVDGTAEAAVIHCAGDLNVRADGALETAYIEVAALEATQITLDFERVGYINSTGIALIVRLLAGARRDRREVRARGLSEHYREIFRITRLSDFMTLDDDLEATSPKREGETR